MPDGLTGIRQRLSHVAQMAKAVKRLRDTGIIDVGNLRYSVGGGVRWLSPFGPLRLELGVPLNRKGDEKQQLFQFSFGAPLYWRRHERARPG